MKKKLSVILILLGMAMILGAAALLLRNQQEAEEAALVSARILPKLSAYVESAAETATAPPPVEDPALPPREMTVAEIDGLPCLGVLTIPAIGYESPVYAETTDEYLHCGACRFHGSVYAGGFVVCAHNYQRLFSRITELRPDDLVWFTDMDGLTWSYTVLSLDTLQDNMVEEMIDESYDFTFFTCTYGGQARYALRCKRS